MRLRLLSALVLAPLALACLWIGGLAWAGLVLLAGGGVAYEWHGLARGRRLALAGGVVYFGPALLALLWLRADPLAGRGNVLFVMLVVWASDIGAYLAGRALGGPKLAPRISPGKTRSGALGGLVGAALVGLAAAMLGPGASRGWAAAGHAVAAALALGVASQIGDLLESGLKRHFGVKDSGRLIPGHGGLLDRLDGLLLAAPLAAVLALALGGGVGLWQ